MSQPLRQTKGAISGSGKRVLIVDDSIINRAILGQVLLGKGYDIREAADGETALTLAHDFAPHLILMDIIMPGMSGIEACMRFKADPALADIPVLFVTSLHDEESVVQAFDVGGVDFITKPFRENEIVARVAAHSELYLSRLMLQAYTRRIKEQLEKTAVEEEAGRRVQFRLLPPDHLRLGEFEFQRILMPSLSMSGDFVDYFALDTDRVAFYMLDVAGHGVASAFVSVLVKSFVSHAMRENHSGRDRGIKSPSVLLQELNAQLLHEGLEKHVSMFLGVLDTRHGELLYANGGHFPFPLLCAHGSTQVLHCKSMPVGLFDFARYADATITLTPGSQLVLLSDGVLEILPESTLRDKLARLDQACSIPGITLDQIKSNLGLDRADNLPDDVALLTITRGNHG